MRIAIFKQQAAAELSSYTQAIAQTLRSTVSSNGQHILKTYRPMSYGLFIKRCILEPHKFFSERTGQLALSNLGINCPAIYEGGFLLSKQGVSNYLVMDYLQGHTLDALCRSKPELALAMLPAIVADIRTMMAHQLLHTDINLENIYIIEQQVWWLDTSIRRYRSSKKLHKSLSKAIRRLGSPEYTPFAEAQLNTLLLSCRD